MTDRDRQAEDAGEAYSLDLDEADATERETAIREAVEAVEAVERDVSSRRPSAVDTVEAEAEEADPQLPSSGDDSESTPEVEQLREEVAELRERSLRTLADFENYRRRSERERNELQRQAMAEPLSAFLEVVDNLERALESEATVDDLKVGVEMILRQMTDLNRRFDVEEISALGEPFDPVYHEAVMRREDASVTVPTVVEEFQRGYRMHERLLRPARVVVAVPPDTGPQEGTGEDDGSEPSAPAPGDTSAEDVGETTQGDLGRLDS